MSQPKLIIPSKVVQRGHSLYVLMPPSIKHKCDLTPGLECSIILDSNNKLHLTFE